MTEWRDVIRKKGQRRRRPKKEPFDPFTGKGVRRPIPETEKDFKLNITPNRKEEIERKTERISSSKSRKMRPKEVHHSKGGISGRKAKRRGAKMHNPKSRCAMCAKRLTVNQRYHLSSLTPESTDTQLSFCYQCAKFKEGGEPVKAKDRPPTRSRWKRKTRG